MKRKNNCLLILPKIFIAVLLVLANVHSQAQGFLKTDGQRIVNEKGENVLLRGIGLGGWMLQEGYMLKVYRDGRQHKIRQRIDSLIGPERTKEFYDAWLANHTTKADIDSLKEWGFNSVRLPMHYNLYTLAVKDEKVAGENTWLNKGFEMTDSLLSWCKSNGMYLILDLHAAPGGQGNDLNIADRDNMQPSLWDSEADQKKMIALWKKLAEHYVNEPYIGGYDIINEPNWGFDDLKNDANGTKEQHNAPLKKLMEEITAAIRQVDKKHIIIIEGNGWGNNYKGILPPWDNNMVLSFHKYWNYNNTASIQHILDARNTYNVPVWVGETGENSNVWYTQAIHLFETNNIGWAWWPLKKIGNNNPFEVKMNPGYEKILAYFNSGAAKPSADEAYNGLMQLAAGLKTGSVVFHKDVIDAMFRQPFTMQAIPFKNNEVSGSSSIDAADYDLGRNGAAYMDNDTADYHVSGVRSVGNKGGVYRNDGVDITRDSTGGYFVNNMDKGEWLQYTVVVKKAGNYKLELLMTGKSAAKVSLYCDDKMIGTNVDVPVIPVANNWQKLSAGNYTLKKGKHVIRLKVDEGGCNFKSIHFSL
ncbi:cellulase family glycosylhydrolase [Ferruginibacter sp.]